MLTLVTPAARASLFLVFDRTSAPAGAIINAHTEGNGAFTDAPGALPLFLARAKVANRIGSARHGALAVPEDALVPIGSLAVDDRGNASTTFAVPDVPPGRYLVIVDCEACADSSGGRRLLVVGPFPKPFAVLPGAESPPPPAEPGEIAASSGDPLAVWVGAVVILSAVVGAIVWFRRRRVRARIRFAYAGATLVFAVGDTEMTQTIFRLYVMNPADVDLHPVSFGFGRVGDCRPTAFVDAGKRTVPPHGQEEFDQLVSDPPPIDPSDVVGWLELPGGRKQRFRATRRWRYPFGWCSPWRRWFVMAEG